MSVNPAAWPRLVWRQVSSRSPAVVHLVDALRGAGSDGALAALRYWRAVLPRPRGEVAAERRHVVMLVVSHLRVDPRVERAARSLVGAGYRVTVIYPDAYEPRFDVLPIDWGEGIDFRPLSPESTQFVFRFPWLCGEEMHRAACAERPFAFHCHDLNTALIGLSAARQTGAACVCDFHEWYSENVSWDYENACWGPHPRRKRRVFRLAERLVLKRADAVVTVCDSIAKELSNGLSGGSRAVHVIRNIPPLHPPTGRYPGLRESLGIGPGQFVLLWQGGTGPSRLIEPIIEALVYAPTVDFVIRGPSLEHFGAAYETLADRLGVRDRVHLLDPVPSGDVVDAAASADAGVWTLPNLSKNFYYALPNKIFEYLAAGIPVLAANYPEARKMVEERGVGLCFDPYDPRSIAGAVNRLATESGVLERCRAAIPHLLEEIDAEGEWSRLVEIYGQLQAGQTV